MPLIPRFRTYLACFLLLACLQVVHASPSYAEPASCASCHGEVVKAWEASQHARANHFFGEGEARWEPLETLRDGLELNETHYQLRERDGQDLLAWTGPDEVEHEKPIAGYIGLDPLQQLLVETEPGKWQATAIAWDPVKREWFDIFGEEVRLPGEWGHWTGQGMNWNANCAACHMTDYEAGLDVETGQVRYHSQWTFDGIACSQCHPGALEHAKAWKQEEAKEAGTLTEMSAQPDHCAACHSRRRALRPGSWNAKEPFHAQFQLQTMAQPGVYYPDGQIREEVYVYGSFLGSSMHAAGVTCLDCHDAHTAELKLPVEDNSLCMQCHSNGRLKAPIIEPEAHSRHPAGSAGNQCVSCHMPERHYMQRDPRRDHGFHSPDPRLSMELGTPNACLECHAERDNQWAAEQVESWFPLSPAREAKRERARLLARAHAGDREVISALAERAEQESNAFWKASLLEALGYLPPHTASIRACARSLDHPDPLVRAMAYRTLAVHNPGSPLPAEALSDPERLVRVTTAAVLAEARPLPEKVRAELEDYYREGLDRPNGALYFTQQAAIEGRQADFLRYAELAQSLDTRNPELLRDLAVLHSRAGLHEKARTFLREALALDEESASLRYSLALIEAELGASDKAIELLQAAVEREPGLERAWYNLALLLKQVGREAEAYETLKKGFEHHPRSESLQQLLQYFRQSAR